jgi:hypothetical protein
MATFSPTFIFSTPPLQITMAGEITYEEFANMLGILNLLVRSLFIEAETGDQVNAGMFYNIYDSSGLAHQETLKPRKDPYQKQNSLYLQSSHGPILLNGLSYISFNIGPLQTISMTICVNQIEPTNLEPGKLIDNFSFRAGNPDAYDRYKEFKECL